ncbi:metallophosphoesterase family protein [Chloroflexales bacterium ZM16-3]|nr:metallophosphoesterase family protein [Chloroflexales bacterium ZM16-3]
MKIAILADTHANLAALHAVIEDIDSWAPDAVIFAGDMVNRGPQSDACLDLTLRLRDERGWRVIAGNHERYMLRYAEDVAAGAVPSSGPRYEFSRLIGWAYSQVSDRLPAIAALSDRYDLATPAGTLRVMHASVRHDRDGVLEAASDDELREQIDPTAAVFCVGHTHMPFVRQVDATLLVNVGSVGLPFDGDTRAAYARLTLSRGGWAADIRRVAYDVAISERAFVEGGAMEAIGPMAEIMLRELRTGTSLMFDFLPRYSPPIHAGEISVADAVRAFLDG